MGRETAWVVDPGAVLEESYVVVEPGMVVVVGPGAGVVVAALVASHHPVVVGHLIHPLSHPVVGHLIHPLSHPMVVVSEVAVWVEVVLEERGRRVSPSEMVYEMASPSEVVSVVVEVVSEVASSLAVVPDVEVVLEVPPSEWRSEMV